MHRVGNGLATVYDSAITVLAKIFITYCVSSECLSDRCFLGLVICTDIYCHTTGTSLVPRPFFLLRPLICLQYVSFSSSELDSKYGELCNVACMCCLTNNPTRCTILCKYIYLSLFSTCFGHPSAYHQEKITVSMRHWYLSLCMCVPCTDDAAGRRHRRCITPQAVNTV